MLLLLPHLCGQVLILVPWHPRPRLLLLSLLLLLLHLHLLHLLLLLLLLLLQPWPLLQVQLLLLLLLLPLLLLLRLLLVHLLELRLQVDGRHVVHAQLLLEATILALGGLELALPLDEEPMRLRVERAEQLTHLA